MSKINGIYAAGLSVLDENLASGKSRLLTDAEVLDIFTKQQT